MGGRFSVRCLRWSQPILACVAAVFLAVVLGRVPSGESACPDLARAPNSRWQVAVDKGWRTPPTKPSFTQHIQPILSRTVG